MAKSVIVVERAKPLDYLTDFVVLPKEFGTPAYDHRADVQAIRETVDAALDKLNERVDFTSQLSNNRPVIIKPNLVSVYHDSGFDERDYLYSIIAILITHRQSSPCQCFVLIFYVLDILGGQLYCANNAWIIFRFF